jgi:predicted RNase H-like HicB family nuclease
VSKSETLNVNVSHDKTQNVWYVLTSDIPGLHAEAETLDELVAVISDVAPDLVAANLPDTSADTAIRIQHMVNAKPARAA